MKADAFDTINDEDAINMNLVLLILAKDSSVPALFLKNNRTEESRFEADCRKPNRTDSESEFYRE